MNKKLFLNLACIIAIIFVYLPSLQGPFVFDDTHTIARNESIKSLSFLPKVWTSARHYSVHADNWGYRPLTSTFFIICHFVGDGATWPFHLFKIFVFIGLCFLLRRIWLALYPSASNEVIFLGFLLFALNPIHTQVVSYISATTTLLAGFFICLSILIYLKYRMSQQTVLLAPLMASVSLGFFAKEEGVVIIALIPIVELYLRKMRNEPLIPRLPWIAFLAVFLAAGFAGTLIFNFFEPTSNIARGSFPRDLYFATQLRAYLFYLIRYFVPIGLNADNLQFSFSLSWFDIKVLSAIFGNIAVLIFAAWAWFRKPVFTLAIIWFYIGASPSSSIIPLAEPVNDHRAFVGYLGWSLVALFAVQKAHSFLPKRAFLALATILVVTFASMTFLRNFVWADNEQLWMDTVAKNPNSGRALNNLAVTYMGQARYTEAAALLEKCHKIANQYGLCYSNYAVIKAAIGQDKLAEDFLEKGKSIFISRYTSLELAADFYSKRGQFTRALQSLHEIDKFNDGRILDVKLKMLGLHLNMNQFSLAREMYMDINAKFNNPKQLLDFAHYFR